MTETLYDSRRVRLLTLLDEGNREGLEIATGVSLPSRRVVRVLNELADFGPALTTVTESHLYCDLLCHNRP